MGYYIQAYSVDAAKIKAVWNSKDEALFQTLKTELASSFEDNDAYFELDDSNDSTAILKDIINGEINHPELAYLYGYVYEALCNKFGKHVNPKEEDIHLKYLEEVVATYSAFIPIPFSSDFPHVLSIATANLKEMKDVFLEVEFSHYSKEDMAIYSAQFKTIFDQAIAEQTDLVLFNY